METGVQFYGVLLGLKNNKIFTYQCNKFLFFRMFCSLPKTTPEGDRVSICKFFDSDPSKFNITGLFKLSFAAMESHMREDLCSRHIAVYDLSGTTMAHAGAFTLPVMKKFLVFGLVSTGR